MRRHKHSYKSEAKVMPVRDSVASPALGKERVFIEGGNLVNVDKDGNVLRRRSLIGEDVCSTSMPLVNGSSKPKVHFAETVTAFPEEVHHYHNVNAMKLGKVELAIVLYVLLLITMTFVCIVYDEFFFKDHCKTD